MVLSSLNGAVVELLRSVIVSFSTGGKTMGFRLRVNKITIKGMQYVYSMHNKIIILNKISKKRIHRQDSYMYLRGFRVIRITLAEYPRKN